MVDDARQEGERPGSIEQDIMVSCPIVDLESTTSMLTLDDWQSLRWLHLREGKSIRWISRHFGITRNDSEKVHRGAGCPSVHGQ